MKYIDSLTDKLRSLETKADVTEKIAEMIAQSAGEDRLVHVFGADQRSAALIADIFFKPGCLTHIDPMLDPTLDIAHGAYRNAMALAVDQLAPCILDYYERVNKGDLILLIGEEAEEMTFAQAADWAESKGLKIIAVTGNGSCKAAAQLELEAAGNQFTAVAAAAVNLIMTAAAEKLPETMKWKGEHEVNLEEEEEKINSMLFRIRHL